MPDPRDDDVIDAAEAAALAEVPAEQLQVLVDQGVLTPVPTADGGTGYARSEVLAARLMGG